MPTRDNEIAQVAAHFYVAANAHLEGDAGPLLALWSEHADSLFFDARSRVHQGRAAITTYLENAALQSRSAPARAMITGDILQTYVSGRLAYAVAIEHFQITHEGVVQRAMAHTTNIYRLEEGRWRLVHRAMEPLRMESESTVDHLDRRSADDEDIPVNEIE